MRSWQYIINKGNHACLNKQKIISFMSKKDSKIHFNYVNRK